MDSSAASSPTDAVGNRGVCVTVCCAQAGRLRPTPASSHRRATARTIDLARREHAHRFGLGPCDRVTYEPKGSCIAIYVWSPAPAGFLPQGLARTRNISRALPSYVAPLSRSFAWRRVSHARSREYPNNWIWIRTHGLSACRRTVTQAAWAPKCAAYAHAVQSTLTPIGCCIACMSSAQTELRAVRIRSYAHGQ